MHRTTITVFSGNYCVCAIERGKRIHADDSQITESVQLAHVINYHHKDKLVAGRNGRSTPPKAADLSI